MVKAMLETNITPDFIVVDGAEGGTQPPPWSLSITWACHRRKACCWCTTAC